MAKNVLILASQDILIDKVKIKQGIEVHSFLTNLKENVRKMFINIVGEEKTFLINSKKRWFNWADEEAFGPKSKICRIGNIYLDVFGILNQIESELQKYRVVQAKTVLRWYNIMITLLNNCYLYLNAWSRKYRKKKLAHMKAYYYEFFRSTYTIGGKKKGYAQELQHLFHFVEESIDLGLQPFIMTKEEMARQTNYFKEAPSRPFMDALKKNFDIHVLFDTNHNYSKEMMAELVSEGKVVFGNDQGFSKTQFAVIPFIIYAHQGFKRLLPAKYYEEIRNFAEDTTLFGIPNKEKLIELIPPTVTIPMSAEHIPSEIMRDIFEYFAKTVRCEKVIVKGANSAAWTGGAWSVKLGEGNFDNRINPHIVLHTKVAYKGSEVDVADLQLKLGMFEEELRATAARYGQSDCLLIQAMVRNRTSLEEAFEEVEHSLVDHKASICGDRIRRETYKRIWGTVDGFFDDSSARQMGGNRVYDIHDVAPNEEVKGFAGLLKRLKKKAKSNVYKVYKRVARGGRPVLVARRGKAATKRRIKNFLSGHDNSFLSNDAQHYHPELELMGDFMNLISPFGAHAIDMVFGEVATNFATKEEMYAKESQQIDAVESAVADELGMTVAELEHLLVKYMDAIDIEFMNDFFKDIVDQRITDKSINDRYWQETLYPSLYRHISRHLRQIFFLEANSSKARGDLLINTLSEEYRNYLEWAVEHQKKSPEAAGDFTKKLLGKLKKEEVNEFLAGVEKLWRIASSQASNFVLVLDSYGKNFQQINPRKQFKTTYKYRHKAVAA